MGDIQLIALLCGISAIGWILWAITVFDKAD